METCQYNSGAYVGTEASDLLNTKKSITSVGSTVKANENILTPDLVEGRVATIRFQKQHAPGAIQRMIQSGKSSQYTLNTQESRRKTEDLTPSSAENYQNSIRQVPKVKNNFFEKKDPLNISETQIENGEEPADLMKIKTALLAAQPKQAKSCVSKNHLPFTFVKSGTRYQISFNKRRGTERKQSIPTDLDKPKNGSILKRRPTVVQESSSAEPNPKSQLAKPTFYFDGAHKSMPKVQALIDSTALNLE